MLYGSHDNGCANPNEMMQECIAVLVMLHAGDVFTSASHVKMVPFQTFEGPSHTLLPRTSYNNCVTVTPVLEKDTALDLGTGKHVSM